MARHREAGAAAALGPLARSASVLGCTPVLPRHYRVIRRLADYGFFHAGGLLIGTHAFLAYGNMLGVRWGGTGTHTGHRLRARRQGCGTGPAQRPSRQNRRGDRVAEHGLPADQGPLGPQWRRLPHSERARVQARLPYAAAPRRRCALRASATEHHATAAPVHGVFAGEVRASRGVQQRRHCSRQLYPAQNATPCTSCSSTANARVPSVPSRPKTWRRPPLWQRTCGTTGAKRWPTR